MAINPNLEPKSCADRSDGEVFSSQSRNWLTERFAYLPQVRLVFGENSPGLPRANGNSEDS
jgi:hypothetical protein